MYENLTVESLKESIKENIPIDISKGEGTFLDSIVSAFAYELWKYYRSLDILLPIAFVDETSGDYILKRALEYGIERKSGDYAKTLITFTGNEGVAIPLGTVVLTDDGLSFKTTQEGVIEQGGNVQVIAQADEIGSKYNVFANKLTVLQQSITGINTVTNEAAAVGGVDEETVESVLTRLNAFRQKPSTSGNVYDYKNWALSVSGVGAVKVFPLWNGNGTVKVIICDDNMLPASAETVNTCKGVIEENRPVGADVTVLSAESLNVSISAQIIADGTVSVSDIKGKFETAVREYFNEIAFEKYTILYNRIVLLLLSIDGVEDYSSLTINGGTGNVIVQQSQIPVLNTVEVTTGA